LFPYNRTGIASEPQTVTVFATTEGIPFVPVTGITRVPASATAGTPLALTGTVAPANATNNTIVWIVWIVWNSGATGATIDGNTLRTATTGTATIRATIAGGASATTAFTQDFTVTVSQGPGEGGFTIGFADFVDMAPEVPIIGPVIRLGGGWETITVTDPAQYDVGSIGWFFLGTRITGTMVSGFHGETLTLGPLIHGNLLGVGTHFLTVEVSVNGVPYSRRIAFTVER